MTAYNERDRIGTAIRSLLDQDAPSFEVLVVDDGSTDGTADLVAAIPDPRLRLVRLPRTGRSPALASAVQEARGDYVANLDADDEALPGRLRLQAAFLDTHPDHAWVGSAEELIDTRRGERYTRHYPTDDRAIRLQTARCIPYSHSAAMFRRSLLDETLNYDPSQRFLIDFEFFIRVAKRHKVANLPEVLIRRRVRAASYFQSRFSTARQNLRLARLCARAVHEFGLPKHHYVYPLMRVGYPYIPDRLKRQVRRAAGLVEGVEPT